MRWWGLAIAGCAPARDGRPAITLSAVSVPGPGIEVTPAVDPPAAITLRCAAPDLADEVHQVEIPADATGPVVLRGLLSDTAYTCVATGPGGAIGATSVVTPPLPDGLPDRFEVTESDPRSAGGFTLTNWFRTSDASDQHVIVVDPEGRVRWHWELGEDCSSSLDAAPAGPGRIVVGGGETVNPRLVDLDGHVSWISPDPEVGDGFHHHVESLPDGDVLSLVTTFDQRDGVGPTWRGFRVEQRDPDTDAVTWDWNSQQGVDAGTLAPGAGDDNPYHANAAAVVDDDPDGPAVWISAKAQNAILRIDRGTEVLRDAIGVGGAFSLYDADGAPLTDLDWFYGQHAIEVDLPFVRMIDNGVGRPGHFPSTRALELEVDLEARTATIGWSWTEDGWFEPVWGDIDALAGGPEGPTVRITRGHFVPDGVAPIGSGPSSIVEVDRATGDVVWRLVFDAAHAVYKSERVDPCWLTHHTTYCPGGSGP
ncbi:MAG: aryl-sulfate sulfotransferase [Myxococcota bacterium]